MPDTISLPCGSTHPQAMKAAAEFPAKLFSIHQGRIVLRDTAVYYGNGTSKGSKGKGLDVLCSVCGHEWSAAATNLLQGKSCPNCKRLNNINSAGKKRCPHASPEEKARAALLRSDGHTIKAIAEMLGRSPGAIQRWLDPQQVEKQRQYSAKWRATNKEQYKASLIRYKTEFTHGKEAVRKANNKRRALEWEATFEVFLDGEFHQVEMMPFIESWEDRNTFVAYEDCVEYAKLQAIAKEMELEHGEPFAIDHIVPLSRGGLHHSLNFRIIPASQNSSKGNKRIPEDEALFLRRIFNITP